MTIAFHWYTKETFTQDEAAKMLSDITVNHTVTGLVLGDADDGQKVDISDGHGRCEGWRVVLSGSHQHTMVAASGDTTYYLYLELTYNGDKVTAVTVEEYVAPQSTTDRIYLGTVDVLSPNITLVESFVNTYTFESTKVRISGDVTLADWRHVSDLETIDGANIYSGSMDIVNADVNASAAIAWTKISKSGSNITDIATRAHSSLTGIGSNSHSSIDSHISDTTNPHGSSMTVGTRLTTNQIYNTGDIGILSNEGDIHITPEGKIFLNDDIQVGGNILHTGTSFDMNSTTHDNIELVVECTSGAYAGGINPNSHEAGHIGGTATAFWSMAARTIKYGGGGHSSYSHRDDLEDLRAIKEYVDSKGKPKKLGEHGDPVWDARTIPEYIRDKISLEEQTEKGTPEMAYLDIRHMTGWYISLLKKLDEIDTEQDEKLTLLHDEIESLKTRMDA